MKLQQEINLFYREQGNKTLQPESVRIYSCTFWHFGCLWYNSTTGHMFLRRIQTYECTEEGERKQEEGPTGISGRSCGSVSIFRRLNLVIYAADYISSYISHFFQLYKYSDEISKNIDKVYIPAGSECRHENRRHHAGVRRGSPPVL